jgi:drug/metabolite transporter (DMT)-like permease
VTAVVLALGSAALFGGMTVAIRLGLGGGKAASASLAMLLWACGVAAVAALPRHDLDGTWPFLLAGMLAPGCSQVLFTLSVREAGPSRTSVTVGAAPLVAVAIALVVGAVAIVAGGLALAGERGRPEHVRVAALLFAVGATVLFAVRDNVVRALHTHASPESAVLATLLAGAIVSLTWARRAPTRSELRRLAPAGILFGLSYVCLYEAYFRGPVSVVSPLVATESLWGVGLSARVLGRSERVGRRLALGAVLVVTGGALIGVTR